MTYVSQEDIEARLGGNVLAEQKAGLADALLPPAAHWLCFRCRRSRV